MDALLIALLASAFAEMGDKTQLLALLLAVRFRSDGAVLAGIALATILNCALSAAGGWLISGLIGSNARTLFFGLPFLFAGVGMLLPLKPPEDAKGWRIGPFFTAFLTMFILEFGDKSQFITAGVAVHTADPLMAAAGASTGIFLALSPVVLMRKQFFLDVPLGLIRRVAAVLFLLIGVILALKAFELL
ncbi:TMEM165/GDT1 family protein [Rhizorhapis suberifaciens]|uniref:GDT1 family protein n=1 Tax=Rhizorhapis suberifaciens TaxID=13656 RepID=A0A840HS27_9SPHN|nr:TMEM165/GDT1 family protein [Rhizorhapis suberifaciens]MBB4640775.1 putative Ca2+/H+ antiporter (TMEM165/GDT1 family) [Rhizorhapis suberifaciens]